ncbi:MAG: MarR family winged helix-turn-helix transcriptional regulator [Hyphomonadaceae bacterium]
MHLMPPPPPVKPRVAKQAKAGADPLQAFAQQAMADCLCMGVRTAARRLVAFYEARLQPVGRGIAQVGLLGSIAAEKDAPAARLARRLGLDPSTLSRTLRPLEEQGLVEIAADPKNLRARRVRLTGEGRARLAAAGQAWARAQKEAAKRVDPGLVAQLLEASEKLKP